MAYTLLGFLGGVLFGAAIAGFLIYYRMKHQIQSAEMKYEILGQSMQKQEDLSQRMNQQFELMAQKIFEEKSTKFTEQNHKNIFAVLEPLREKLKDFEKKVEDSYATERSERGMLRGELSKLMELNKVMSTEAQNLSRALKGENKTQGNWGELILENILERSGLRKNEEYVVQGTDLDLRGEEGQILRPDVIVNLPDSKHLIVDAKMTLNAYEAYSNASTPEDQERYGKMHIESLRKHIEGLSNKKYHAADKLVSPDFVMLFMPVEPAFALAFRLKPDLFQYAWERNIAIVSPTTLLATLRTVSALWKQERQERNALEIADRGGKLYEKFVGLVKDLENLGDKLGAAQTAHEEVVKKMSEGRGNLIDQVEDLKRLGAKTDKMISQKLKEKRLED